MRLLPDKSTTDPCTFGVGVVDGAKELHAETYIATSPSSENTEDDDESRHAYARERKETICDAWSIGSTLVVIASGRERAKCAIVPA